MENLLEAQHLLKLRSDSAVLQPPPCKVSIASLSWRRRGPEAAGCSQAAGHPFLPPDSARPSIQGCFAVVLTLEPSGQTVLWHRGSESGNRGPS